MNRRFPAVLVGLSAIALGLVPLTRAVAQGRLEVRAGGVTLLSRRAAMFEGAVGTGSGIMPGGEFLLRLRYLGLKGRLFGGAFSADSGNEAVGRVRISDVRLLAGPRFLAAEVGYGRRAFSGALGDRSWPFARRRPALHRRDRGQRIIGGVHNGLLLAAWRRGRHGPGQRPRSRDPLGLYAGSAAALPDTRIPARTIHRVIGAGYPA